MESQVGILRNPPKVYRQRPHIKRNKLLAQINLDRQFIFFAESGGFEPSIRLRVYRISSAALSTTQTTFRFSACKDTAFFLITQKISYFFLIVPQMYHPNRKQLFFE